MTEVLNGGWLRVVGYFVAAAAALWAARRDRDDIADRGAVRWPMFWYLSAGLLASMAIARGGHIGDLISSLGRSVAEEGGWYEARRTAQTVVVVAVTSTWFVTISLAFWRVPERRRRYLPAALVLFSLVCFGAVRIVSLHQIDTVLYRRDIAGVRIVSIIELFGLASAVLAMFWYPFIRDRQTELIDA